MAEKPENLLLETMRRFDGRQARFEDALRAMSGRLSSIERYLARLDRLDRIERRLELHGSDD